MTLNELIERLEEIRDHYEIAGDTPILGAFQPNYPLTASIAAVTTVQYADSADIYIALGEAREYGTRSMWDDDLVESGDDEDEE